MSTQTVTAKPKQPGEPFPQEYPNTWPQIDAKAKPHSEYVGRKPSAASRAESWLWVGGARFYATFLQDWKQVYCHEIGPGEREYLVSFEQWQKWYELGIIARAGVRQEHTA